MKVKQVIIIRKDLNMRKGKMVAQGAHASLKVFFDKMRKSEGLSPKGKHIEYSFLTDDVVSSCVEGLFTKICVSVDNELELLEVYAKAKTRGLNCSLIKDAGLTEFKEATYTCVAIGPNKSEDIDLITGKLKLL